MQRLKVTHKIKLHLILATINNIVPFVLELDHKAANPTRVIELQDCQINNLDSSRNFLYIYLPRTLFAWIKSELYSKSICQEMS